MTGRDPDFFKQCEGFRAAARRAWGSRRFGRRRDCGPAHAGTEATDTADYATGDDYRRVDWHRAARLDELVSRLFRGVEIGTLHIVLDRSPSMRIGCPEKSWFAGNLAQALGCLALIDGVCVQVDQARFLGEREMVKMTTALEEGSSCGDNRAFFSAVAAAGRCLRRGDQVVVFSDLLNEDAVPDLAATVPRSKEQLWLVQVLAPEDREPTYLERVGLRDVESGTWLGAELFDEDLANYRDEAAEFGRQLRRQCAARAIPLVQLCTSMSLVRGMEQLIHVARLPANLH